MHHILLSQRQFREQFQHFLGVRRRRYSLRDQMERWVEQTHPERQGYSGGSLVSLRESDWGIISGVVEPCPKSMVRMSRGVIVSCLTRAQVVRNASQILRKVSPVGALV